MSDQENPVKLFFSRENAKKLYGYIQQGLKDQYDVKIDERYMEQMIDIMKMIIEPIKKIPTNVDRTWFVKTLNEQALKEALPIFADIAKGEKLLPRVTPALAEPRRQQNQPFVPPRPAAQTPDDANASESYQKILQSRTTRPPTSQPKPVFEDPAVEYTEDVNDLYEHAEQLRQQRDMLPPPQADTDLPFEPMQGFTLRDKPTEYPGFEPNRFLGNNPPRGSERIVDDRIRPPPILTDHHHHNHHNDKHQNDKHQDQGTPLGNLEHLNFGDVAPQPEQMRVLIPKTSRNLVGDSQIIPHQFILNSQDRNSAVYPSVSQYRIELRQPYIDVVSVELLYASLPLSVYNVDGNSNIINFEETPGTPLEATIPIGNYPDAATLASSVAASLTAASANGVTYTATINPLNGKMTITSDGASGSIFNLLFFGTPTLEGQGPILFQKEKPQYPPNSIGSTIGFNSVDYTGSLTYTGPFLPNLNGEPYAYLHIEELEMLESNNSEIHNSFAMITMDGEAGKFAFFEAGDPFRFIKTFSPLKGKLAYLTISFRNDLGQIIEFNGQNHTLSFQIITKDVTQGPYEDHHDHD